MPIHRIRGGGGLELAVHDYGPTGGKAIVLIHGFSQCHLVWSKLFRGLLSDEFRLICPDNRGHGMSEKPTAHDHYTKAELWADDVHAVLTGLALDRPVIVGWSYGGVIVNDYIAKYGEHALGGINYVCSVVTQGVPDKAPDSIGKGFLDHAEGLCSDDLTSNIHATRAFLRNVFATQPTQDEFEEIVAFNMIVPPAVRAGMMARTIDRDDVMRALSIPVLITEGAEDRMVLSTHTAHLRSCIPRATSSVYEGIGHAPPFEDPERFAVELSAFARCHAGRRSNQVFRMSFTR